MVAVKHPRQCQRRRTRTGNTRPSQGGSVTWIKQGSPWMTGTGAGPEPPMGERHREPDVMHKTDLYRKATSTNSLLHATSSHPRHVIEAIPTGQFLRVKKICSTSEDFKIRSKELKGRFAQRGYSHRNIRQALHRAQQTPRDQLLKTSVKNQREQKMRRILIWLP
ncbi:uncharacterized protein LOC142749184 isoform X2 [Rhinoderma darwinii]